MVSSYLPSTGSRGAAIKGKEANGVVENAAALRHSISACSARYCTSASSVAYAVTFSTVVTGVVAGDFQIVTSGSVSYTNPPVVSGSGSSYTVTINGILGSGTLGLNLVDDDSITDGAGNALGGTGAGNASFTGEVYRIDRTAPTVTINQAATQLDPTSTAPMHFTAVFSEPVSGFGNSSVTVGGTAGGSLTAGVEEVGDKSVRREVEARARAEDDADLPGSPLAPARPPPAGARLARADRRHEEVGRDRGSEHDD